MIDLLFGNGYEALLMSIALIAAIPYGIYVGLKKLGTKLFGGRTRRINPLPRPGVSLYKS